MNKMLVATTLLAILGLTGCATTNEPEAPAVAVADASTPRFKQPDAATGSRIPGTRSNMVSSTSAAEAQKSMRDNTAYYTHKN